MRSFPTTGSFRIAWWLIDPNAPFTTASECQACADVAAEVSRKYTCNLFMEAISVSRMRGFDRRCLSFYWQAFQRSKALKEILVCSCWKFMRLTWRLKNCKNEARQEETSSYKREQTCIQYPSVCLHTHKCLLKLTQEFEDVFTLCMMMPAQLLPNPFFPGGLLSHHWLGILFHSDLLMYVVKYCLKKEKKKHKNLDFGV